MQAQHTTTVPVYQMIVAILALAIVLTVGVGLAVSGNLDGLPVVGASESIERVAPSIHRPADRPATRFQLDVAPAPVNHPADRGPRGNGNSTTTTETNRPVDRP